jgi:hypothetical protein
VGKLSRFVSSPEDDHWQALERVMRYLKGIVSYGIHYTGYPRVLEGYCGAIGFLMLMKCMPQVVICFYWWWRCFLEVLQANHFNKLNNGSRTHIIRHH